MDSKIINKSLHACICMYGNEDRSSLFVTNNQPHFRLLSIMMLTEICHWKSHSNWKMYPTLTIQWLKDKSCEQIFDSKLAHYMSLSLNLSLCGELINIAFSNGNYGNTCSCLGIHDHVIKTDCQIMKLVIKIL